MSEGSPQAACGVLFSGGTDSTCAAAICAREFAEIHLLTFEERATRHSPAPTANVELLRKRFPQVLFHHHLISIDLLLREISYRDYLRNVRRHGFFMLSTPGFSALAWHLRAIEYCRKHGITEVRDGMTRELLHFPGHMPAVRRSITELYASRGIRFESPVLDWDVPPDQRFTDRLIVDRHGFASSPAALPVTRTTGAYLHAEGVFPHPNVKGSLFDRRMQHDCFPFVVFNIFVFWWFLQIHSESEYERRMVALMQDKIREASVWLDSRDDGHVALFESEKRLS